MKKAVALKYEPGEDAAPRVVAKGEGKLAERILALAEEAGLPIREDRELVEALMKLEIEAQVPPELYEAVAAVLAWAWKLNGKLP
ncbi:MAG: hypothetical protein GXO17_01845 [Thermodesulfobacteria bacterium]|nr:hypothetical protein [Thermodesulfobacteriota bacterium]